MKHFISRDKAKKMIALYRKERENMVHTPSQASDLLPNSETFDRQAFDTVLAQPGCTGLRIYFGMGDDLKVHAIVVGVNANNEDILPSTTPSASVASIDNATATPDSTSTDPTNPADPDPTDNTGIIEDGTVCPPVCPPPSDLNP